MLSVNDHLFLLLNASQSASWPMIDAAELLASDAIYVVPVLLVAAWIWGPPDRRAGLLTTAISAALALGANQIVGQFWYEPRPFMIGLGRTLLAHAPENSFPSDHTTLMLSLGIGLISTGAAVRWGKLVVVLGLLVGWARVYVGLHFPLDIITSVLIGSLFGALAKLLKAPVERWLLPPTMQLYRALLRLSHLPSTVIPRR